MADIHKALRALNPSIATIWENEDVTFICKDSEGNELTVDVLAAQTWEDPESYVEERISAYPSIQEQLDMQYWDSINGTTTWADAIQAVKDAYPKP